MKIVSWQSVLTDHQSHTLRALQEVAGEPVLIVSGVKSLKERKGQGWTEPDTTGLDVRYLPSSGWWREGLSVLRENPDAIHLFNGLWGDRRFFFFLLEAQRRGIKIGLITEPYSEVATGYLNEEFALKSYVKVKLRPWLYRLAGLLVAKRLCAVFAISEKAVQQFLKIGVRKECMFPFGYFVPAMKNDNRELSGRIQGLRLVFIGSLIKRKGIQTVIEAMKACHGQGVKVSLDVYGPGDESMLAGVKAVRYRGVIPFGEAQQVVAGYDLLVLPSLYDGWGVVVNEALLQEVPVIVSSKVGARVLVERFEAGAVVPAGDVQALAAIIKELAVDRSRLLRWEKNAACVATHIMPERAARYLYEALRRRDSAQVANPWYLA